MKPRSGDVGRCLVCGDSGVLLVPERDVSAYKGTVSYGLLIPLLVSAAVSGAGSAFDREMIFPEAGRRFKAWKKDQLEAVKERAADLDLGVGDEAYSGISDRVLVGAIVPGSVFSASDDEPDSDDGEEDEPSEGCLFGGLVDDVDLDLDGEEDADGLDGLSIDDLDDQGGE